MAPRIIIYMGLMFTTKWLIEWTQHQNDILFIGKVVYLGVEMG
jgi:hypothetical protein